MYYDVDHYGYLLIGQDQGHVIFPRYTDQVVIDQYTYKHQYTPTCTSDMCTAYSSKQQ